MGVSRFGKQLSRVKLRPLSGISNSSPVVTRLASPKCAAVFLNSDNARLTGLAGGNSPDFSRLIRQGRVGFETHASGVSASQ
jgi:hypothetical protein